MKVKTLLSRRTMIGAMAGSVFAPPHAVGQSQKTATSEKEGLEMRIEISFSDQVFTATLFDNPSARDLVSLLPFGGKVEDYSNNEKIVYLPRKLTEEGSGPFGDEAVGDLCYYAPWGNLVFYYGGYHYSRGLIRLGRLDDGVAPLLKRGEFPVNIRRAD